MGDGTTAVYKIENGRKRWIVSAPTFERLGFKWADVRVLPPQIVDNIPFTATMIPVIQDLARAEDLTEAQTRPLWWSLALGADFGGNLTLIGASANVVVAGMSERAGQRISFVKFMLYGIPVTLASLALATAYVVLRYF